MLTANAELLTLVVLGCALFAVSISDAKSRRIPNAYVLFILGTGLVRAAALGGVNGAAQALAGAILGGALLLFQFKRGLIGAGDVKLLAAIGSWTGAMGAVYVFLFGSALGGALSVVALLRLTAAERLEVTRNLAVTARTGGMAVPEPSALSRARGIPYGISLSVAAIGVCLVGVVK